MKWLIIFSILTTTAFSHNLYKNHLPSSIYEQIIQRKLVDENGMGTTSDVKHGAAADKIVISVVRSHGEYVQVGYRCGQAVDDFGGMLAGYQEGKIIGFVVFDEMGRDYLFDSPYSKEMEKNITLSLLDLIEGGYMKLVENSKIE